MTFYSYSPYYFQEAGNNATALNPSAPVPGANGFVFANYDVSAHQQTDLMVADIQYGQTANVVHGGEGSQQVHTGVPTIFRHKLALIGGFILSTSQDYDGDYDESDVGQGLAEEGNMRFKILEIKFNDIQTVGTFTSEGISSVNAEKTQEQWTLSTNETGLKDYTWYTVRNDKDEFEKNDKNEIIVGREFGHVESKQLHIYNSESNIAGHKQVDPTIENGYLLAIPQQFLEGSPSSLTVVYLVETYDGTKWNGGGNVITKTVPLKDIHKDDEDKGWAINKKLVYKLEFATAEIRWAPSVVVWEPDELKFDY